MANTVASRKAKGRSFQQEILTLVRGSMPFSYEDLVKSATMGESGVDIQLVGKARELFPFAVECKNQERINIWESWEQCEDNAKKEKLMPALFFKRNRKLPLVTLRASDFFMLLNYIDKEALL